MIFTNARVVTFDRTNRVIDSGSVEVRSDGTFGTIESGRRRGAEVVDAGGRLLMPALINCHSHLYSVLARGMVLPGPAPANFGEILRRLWWRLDRALTLEDVYYSALVGLVDSAKCGVGTVIDHHSSPGACANSLDTVEAAFHKIGLRGATCYEMSDRNGRSAAQEAIGENIRFATKRRNKMVGAAFGLHASFTLSDRTLRTCLEANQSLQAPFHVHVAEAASDAGAVRRLIEAGILGERSLAAHCVHITASERRMLACRGVNVVHNPQSNCNNAVGIAGLSDLIRAGVLVGLGSDGYSPRMWDEFKTAFHLQKLKARDPRAGYDEAFATAFRNNRIIVEKLWGLSIGRIESGAAADFILVDYFPPTPIHAGNLFGHLLFGIANQAIDTLVVNGRFVVREKRCVTIDERRLAQRAAVQAKALWTRI
jgi:putative selenium metabolism protein SsnA